MDMTAPTIIASHTRLKGVLNCEGDCIIHGSVEGDIFSNACIIIEKGATIKGTLHAPTLIVQGYCEGIVECDAVKILPLGHIQGSLKCHLFIMKPQAIFTGTREVSAPLYNTKNQSLEFDTENILL